MERIIISIPKELLAALDKRALVEKYNRSELLRHLIRKFLATKSKETDEVKSI